MEKNMENERGNCDCSGRQGLSSRASQNLGFFLGEFLWGEDKSGRFKVFQAAWGLKV